ncbi:Major facilitator superfamily domain general substrate transporter [Penicillium taxi]|uniref:Major facilitator superfamily domain general substrate transporter n=1 Tax=Penicillium taxi TaxID=168475 RepID=UPI0025451733|nr:Major facilitator superfamily domain general substrate transporter [Penicillium taxi]KAJ5887951.1 Major facilitator superfamily domain general substrate transporter [Penicillium taxi]
MVKVDKEYNYTNPSATADVEALDIKYIDKHADIGLQFLAQSEKIEYTEEEARRVKHKTDLYLLPILSLTYGLQYLDKVTTSYAAVYGMRTDLGLKGQEYSWITSIFYLGFLVAQGPSSYLLTKFSIGKYAAVNVFLWGTMVCLCACTKNFAGIAVLRFFMGVFESAIGPCWVSLMATFYKKEEQGSRVTTWYGCVGLAAIIGGLLSYGVGQTHSGLAEWQLIFLICGGFTVVWSIVILLFLPSDPTTAKFLTPREKLIAVERLRNNRTGLRSSVFKWSQALEALRDPQCWMIAAWAGISNITNIAGSFLPLIIKDMGFTDLMTVLLTLPVGGVEIIAMLFAGLASSQIKNGRTIIIFVVACPTLAGIVMLDVLPETSTWARTAGVWLVLCVPAGYAILLSLISSNVAGFSKKLMTTSMCFVSSCVANIVSPQLFISTEAPRYATGLRAMLVSICLCLFLCFVMGVYYNYENRRRDRECANLPEGHEASITIEYEEFLDRTDKEDWVKFRYSW